MRTRLLAIAIERETDIVLVRQRTRDLAAHIGFDRQDQTRITTAVSEIARNAWDYGGGGRIEYWVAGDTAQALEILVQDSGPGIAQIGSILAGDYDSLTGMGLGIIGARRLVDGFDVETAPGRGTLVRMRKALPRRGKPLAGAELAGVAKALASDESLDPVAEIRRQNREMLEQLEELNRRQQELEALNQELQDTNRGVVALYSELDERADHLRRADELKSRFLSNMTHEFRTPLNSILALSRLLIARSDGELTPEQDRQVQYIRKAAENLTEIVNDLLDLAKVEAGKTVVAASEFTAGSLFGALRGMLRPLLLGDAVALSFEEAGDIPPLFSDESKVSQILRNFISNALKFTEEGEVRVWAQYEPGSDTVTFAVRDTGIGIAPEAIDTIWQEFSQIENPLQKKVKGTGLGLPLSKKFAELLGGAVAVESAPGQGSVFRVTLPRLYRQAHEPEEALPPFELEPGRKPVLSVEDNPADAFACERALATTRYQPMTVRNLAAARRAVAAIAPVAVLLDVLLAGEEAWSFLIELKQNPATEHIPVIVLSNSHEEGKARGLGAEDYLGKPVDPGLLLRALDRVTGGHSVTRVLVVDDEEVSRYLVRQLLPRGAYELSEATTGLDGLRRVREDKPDIVLLDLKMPVMDGYDFLDRLAASAWTSELPAIVLTSAPLTPDQRRRLARATQIVSKADLSSATLLSAIRHALALGEAGTA